jgi:CheY-like chemotaxis protein
MKGGLDVRQAAESDPSLTIEKYFEMLAEFTDITGCFGFLEEIRQINEDTRDWRTIEATISLLNQLKSNKYLPDLYAISNARGKGDARLAAFHAKTMMDDFNGFYLQIMSAKTDALPYGAPDEQASLKKLIKFLDDDEAGRKMMVLAVDDSPAILTAVETVLNKTYNVFKLPRPEMLESVLTQVRPDLFLLDYRMPGLSGFELIPVIRSFAEHKDTPVIFLTSEGTMDHVSAAMALGACDFIVKPFQADMLCQKVAKHIVRKKRF